MRKTTFAVLMIAVLVFGACGGIDGTTPATFGDDDDRKGNRAAQAPANDDFASAENVSRVPFSKGASNSGAALEDGEPRLCGEIDNTVWFTYTPGRDINVTARAAAEFPTVVAVFSGSDMTALTEEGCAAAGNDTSLTFGAIEGQTYHIQIGSSGNVEGAIDVTMRNANQAQLLLGDPGPLLPGWTEKVLVEETPIETPAVGPLDLDLVTIDGAPRPGNPKFYDIRISAYNVPTQTIGLNTGGVLTEPVHVELVQVAKESTKATIKLFYRYDPEQVQCQLDLNGNCVVSLPVNPTDVNWTTEEGPSAELIVMADIKAGKVDINGVAPDLEDPGTVYVRIPLIGQVKALTG